jgi:hypothetical protein
VLAEPELVVPLDVGVVAGVRATYEQLIIASAIAPMVAGNAELRIADLVGDG